MTFRPVVVKCPNFSSGGGLLTMRNSLIYLSAFFSGFAVMSFEILGSRILAPFFGQSIYVWGALISVVLAALGCGNYYGGRLGDRYCSSALIMIIALICALYFIIAPPLGYSCCQMVTAHITNPQLGVLLAALLVFWIPAFGLGMMTPNLIKLGIVELTDLGGKTGLLLGLMTIGNIAGTLLTSFWLIGLMPTSLALQLLSIPMLLVVIASFICHKLTRST